MTDRGPALTDDDVMALEERQLAAVLGKANAGLTLSKADKEVVARAHERGKRGVSVEQPALPGVETDAEELPASLALHSARYIKERNPKLYDALVLMLKHDVPKVEIQRETGVGQATLRAIADREAGLDEGSKKQRLKLALQRVSVGAWEHIADNLDKMKLEALAITGGISVEKLLLLEGQATAIVQHQTGPSVADIAQTIRELQEKNTRDVTPLEPVSPPASGGQSAALPGTLLHDPLLDAPTTRTVELVVVNHPVSPT